MTRTGRATARRFAPTADGRLVTQTWLGSRAILLVVAVVVMTGSVSYTHLTLPTKRIV